MACQHHLSQAKVRKGCEVTPLALNGTGTVFKKCNMSNHRPETVKQCASATCQHTCQPPEKCPHAWTLRYSVNGKQGEYRDVLVPIWLWDMVKDMPDGR